MANSISSCSFYSCSVTAASARPLCQGRELPLGLVGVLTRVRLPNSKTSQLLVDGGVLSHLLTSSSKLCGQLLMQLHLLGEAVPGVLLVMEELGLLPAASHEGLQRGCKSEV